MARSAIVAGGLAGTVRVEARIINRGGRGQVGVDVAIVERGSGEVLGRETKDVEVEAGATSPVRIDVPIGPLPSGAQLEARVDAHYPIE